jgi:hypothetical protein
MRAVHPSRVIRIRRNAGTIHTQATVAERCTPAGRNSPIITTEGAFIHVPAVTEVSVAFDRAPLVNTIGARVRR